MKPRIKIDNIPDTESKYGLKVPLEPFKLLLFLDFDGVLHPVNKGLPFSAKKRFEDIIRDYPDVKIVFSTSWRHSQNFESLVNRFSEDIRNRFIGTNPTVQEKWPPYTVHERYKECLKFMEDIQYAGHWAAIDDAVDLFPYKHPWLVVTDGKFGLNTASETELRKLLEKSKG